MSITCLDIELALMRKFNFRQNLIVTNITDMMGLVAFETDMLILTKSDLAYGVEIKVTLADLKADFKKKQYTQREVFNNGKYGFEKYYRKFKHFFYAVPENMADKAVELIPEEFGIIVVKRIGANVPKALEVRKPKKLFTYYWSAKERYEVARLGTMRIYNLKYSLSKI